MPTRRARRAQQDRDLEELHQTILSASRTSTPASNQAETNTSVIGVDALVEALKGISGPSRSNFKAPQYQGEGDVDLFITQFRDVALANEWSSQESTLHLRSALTGKAIGCGRGEL